MRLGEIIKEGVRLKDNSNSKNQKSNTQISNNFLVLLIVAAILFSVIGTWISLTRLSPLTGFLGATQAVVNVTVNSTVTFTISPNSTNFSRLNPNDKDDTTDGSPAPMNITNNGNSIINISVSAGDALYDSAALGTFYFQICCANSTFDGNVSLKSNTTCPSYVNVVSSSFVICPYLDFDNSNDTNVININTSVPSAEPAGLKESILTFTATCTNHCLP